MQELLDGTAFGTIRTLLNMALRIVLRTGVQNTHLQILNYSLERNVIEHVTFEELEPPIHAQDFSTL